MRGYTKKPCPGCGESNTYRPTQGVCGDCATAIATAKEAADEMAKRPVGVRVYFVPGAAHWLPYMGEDSGGFDDRTIQKIMYELIFAVSTPSNWDRENGGSLIGGEESSNYGTKVCREMPAHVRDLLDELYQRIIHAIKLKHENGVQRGRRFLVDLARGDLSLNAFEKQKED